MPCALGNPQSNKLMLYKHPGFTVHKISRKPFEVRLNHIKSIMILVLMGYVTNEVVHVYPLQQLPSFYPYILNLTCRNILVLLLNIENM